MSSRAGDVASLSVEVVVNPTNETLTDKNPVSSRLLEAAGPELKEECKSQIISESLCPPVSHVASQCVVFLPCSPSLPLDCRTGEAKITGAYKLPARYIIVMYIGLSSCTCCVPPPYI